MAMYVVLANFTDQGVRNVKDSPKRAEAFKDLAKSSGATVKDLYWTLGQYDIVATVDAPDDMAITALGLTLAKAGNVRTQTLRAFSQAEMGSILSKVG
jgi:uncharacterized protein with GYD domain